MRQPSEPGEARARANFSTRSRTILAQRAAYRCSNPNCGALTIGPGDKGDDVAISGTGAHIYAAAIGGPRGTGGLPPAERSALTNGIWLCATCGRLVDTNEGNAYPAPLLRSWKDWHETRTRLEMGGYARPIGWIQSLDIVDHFLLAPSVVRFSRCNLIIGNNGSGKTVLLSLLQSMSDPDILTRMRLEPSPRINARVNWYDPQPRIAEILAEEHSLVFRVDGVEAFFPPRPFRTISVREPGSTRSGNLTILARSLGIPKWVVRNAVERMPDVLAEAIMETTIDGEQVAFRTPGDSILRPFEYHSGGRQNAFTVQLIATIGEVQARSEPTILLLDAATAAVDFDTRNRMFDLLSSPARSFQTIVTSSTPFQVGHEWTVSLLRRKANGLTHVIQDLPESVAQLVHHEA